MTPAQSASRSLRIGELAERAGTTPRTIRYYEEIGLLGAAEDRVHGRHRSYDEEDLARLEHILRLRDLLGLSLEDLQKVVEAEDARAALRREWHGTDDPDERLRIIEQALGHIGVQLELVERRQAALDELRSELRERRALLERRRGELSA
jgi:MerR family transcriptional regulator, repressor of the yfmOP operon